MKKIRYLLFMFVIMLCMVPNVDAYVATFKYDVVTARHYYGGYYDTKTPSVFDFEYKKFNLIESTKDVNRTLWQVKPKNVTFDDNTDYTVGFWIYETAVAYSGENPNYKNVNPPIVFVGNKTCSVKPLGTSGCGNPGSMESCIYDYNYLFYVECDLNKTMFFDTGAFNVDVNYVANLQLPTTSSGLRNEMYFWDKNSGQSDIREKIEETNEKLGEIDNTINSTDTTGSQQQANSFFSNFNTNDYGLSDIVTMPLQLIRTLTNNTCMPLSLTIPFVDKSFNLPCMSSIYQQHFGNFYSLYQTIIFGFVSYWVIVRIFNLVKDFKNPDHDEIEVLDL